MLSTEILRTIKAGTTVKFTKGGKQHIGVIESVANTYPYYTYFIPNGKGCYHIIHDSGIVSILPSV